jgi:hypothetical protein
MDAFKFFQKVLDNCKKDLPALDAKIKQKARGLHSVLASV